MSDCLLSHCLNETNPNIRIGWGRDGTIWWFFSTPRKRYRSHTRTRVLRWADKSCQRHIERYYNIVLYKKRERECTWYINNQYHIVYLQLHPTHVYQHAIPMSMWYVDNSFIQFIIDVFIVSKIKSTIMPMHLNDSQTKSEIGQQATWFMFLYWTPTTENLCRDKNSTSISRLIDENLIHRVVSWHGKGNTNTYTQSLAHIMSSFI